ncbi:unnamed protein product [Enterobius vermicularis]|uniref:ULP_PROTEASE domain-containing protein n=1 Tax=Enterobius vermicularis TaxID=51028 RepID=A0A0N4VMC7_ENTVE|nr:unnamed protein product [Enterobius vermicularis]
MSRQLAKRAPLLKNYDSTSLQPTSDSECDHEIDVYILSLETILLKIRFPSRSMCIRISDFLCLREGALLNDVIIDFYINHIAAHLLPDDSVDQTSQKKYPDFHYDDRSQVDYWLEQEDVFDADFLVLPINHNQHWSLVVVCSPMLSIKNSYESNTHDSSLSPLLIIFDSQQPVDASLKSNILSTMQQFLELAFARRSSTLSGGRFRSDCFKCVIPKNLPQQKNNVDCGIYILEYARRFLLSPPPIDCLQSEVFDFLSFYPDFDVSDKRCEIQHTVLSLCSDYEIWRNLLNTVDVPFEYRSIPLHLQFLKTCHLSA